MIFIIKFPNSEIAFRWLYQYIASEVNESRWVAIAKTIVTKTIIFMNQQHPLPVLDLEQPSLHTF